MGKCRKRFSFQSRLDIFPRNPAKNSFPTHLQTPAKFGFNQLIRKETYKGQTYIHRYFDFYYIDSISLAAETSGMMSVKKVPVNSFTISQNTKWFDTDC